MKKSALKCSKIEKSEEDELMKMVGEILVEGNSHNSASFGEQYWQWKYRNLPTGQTNVYVIKKEDLLLGYVHAPIYKGEYNGVEQKFAVIQDVAIMKEARGMGAFRQLLEFSTNDIVNSGINVIYTYPNEKSIRTFLKYCAYEQLGAYDSYLFPLKSSKVINSKLKISFLSNIAGFFIDRYFAFKLRKVKETGNIKLHKMTEIPEDVYSLFATFHKSNESSIIRDKAYIDWRFKDRPDSIHYCVSYKLNDKVVASAIFKLDEIFSLNALLLVDFAFIDNDADPLLEIMKYVAKFAGKLFEKEMALIYATFWNPIFLKNKRSGFVKVPDKINPRLINLLVRGREEEHKSIAASQWHATLADWDVI